MRKPTAWLAVALAVGCVPAARAAEIVAPSPMTTTQAVITLAAGVDAGLGSKSDRRYLCVMNVGTGLVNLGFDQAAIPGAGWALDGAAAEGHQGGSMCWEASAVTTSNVHAISADGSVVVVLEGR